MNELTKEEKELLDNYRKASSFGKRFLLETSETFRVLASQPTQQE